MSREKYPGPTFENKINSYIATLVTFQDFIYFTTLKSGKMVRLSSRK